MKKLINKLAEKSQKYQYYETYWCFDLHGVIIEPNYDKEDKIIRFYPYALLALKLLSARDDVRLILHTSSYPEELERYIERFKKHNVHFNYVSENPEISVEKGHFGYYEKKFYFDLMFEDKAGFDPDTWQELVEVIENYPKPLLKWKNFTNS